MNKRMRKKKAKQKQRAWKKILEVMRSPAFWQRAIPNEKNVEPWDISACIPTVSVYYPTDPGGSTVKEDA